MTLMQFIDNYVDFYIQKNGQEKLVKVYQKVTNSSSLSKLDGKSIRLRCSPTAYDFCASINDIAWFFFQNQYTIALAALFAIKLWDERINQVYHFETQESLLHKAIAVFEILKIQPYGNI